ncbi:hypothetical protein G6011_04765 [Alternaria panax]|uniref:BTB domain-containing protein n=1 Tax=Alternaria panax TaxID=48097 RepID=A0AAD4IHG8_9PLEO|nr:hypothetical protein G6011_04765 [Alternaria panax]
MTPLTVDDTSAPVGIEDSNKQQKDESKSSTTTDLIDLTDLSVQKTIVAASYPKHITLDVGGRKFKVSRDTLEAESGLFKRQLSDRFTPWEPEVNGSYFMDADSDLFQHLLRFMRRPEVFPLFYSKMNGFDYDLYNRLQVEALYFQIDNLYEWIKDKKYLTAIKVQTSRPDIHSVQDISLMQPEVLPVNETEEWHIVPRTRKVYLCPRQIRAHRGQPELCGGACHKRQAENAVEYEDVSSLEVVRLQKEIVVDEKACRLE